MRPQGSANPVWRLLPDDPGARKAHGKEGSMAKKKPAIDVLEQGYTLSAALGTDLNGLKLAAHRFLIDDEAEISSFR